MARMPPSEGGTVVVVLKFVPDQHFSDEQRERLRDLMNRWRCARDSGAAFPPDEQRELEAFTQAELVAARDRSKAMEREIAP